MYFGLCAELVALGALVVVECQPRLVPLLKRSLPSVEVVALGSLRCLADDIDFQVPAASLASVLRPNLEGFQPIEPYLIPDLERVAELRRRTQDCGTSILVGVSWRTRHHSLSGDFSIPLNVFEAVLGVEGVRFVSLQYGDHGQEIQASGFPLLVDASVDPLVDMDRFAAQVAAMDLVISIDNSTVSMATGLGKPTWCLVTPCPEWRMSGDGEDSRWHPTLRLFRQSEPGNWSSVVERVREELVRFTGMASC